MVPTRLDTAKLTLASEKALKKIDEALDLLGPYLVILHEAERAKIPRTRDGFDEAARSLSRGIEGHPSVVAATEFDSEAVIEDLDNVKAIQPVMERIAELEVGGGFLVYSPLLGSGDRLGRGGGELSPSLLFHTAAEYGFSSRDAA